MKTYIFLHKNSGAILTVKAYTDEEADINLSELVINFGAWELGEVE